MLRACFRIHLFDNALCILLRIVLYILQGFTSIDCTSYVVLCTTIRDYVTAMTDMSALVDLSCHPRRHQIGMPECRNLTFPMHGSPPRLCSCVTFDSHFHVSSYPVSNRDVNFHCFCLLRDAFVNISAVCSSEFTLVSPMIFLRYFSFTCLYATST